MPQVPAQALHGVTAAHQAAFDKEKTPAQLVAQGKVTLHVRHGKTPAQHERKCLTGKSNPDRRITGFDLVMDQLVEFSPEFIKKFEQECGPDQAAIVAGKKGYVRHLFLFQGCNPTLNFVDGFFDPVGLGHLWKEPADFEVYFSPGVTERIGNAGLENKIEEIPFPRRQLIRGFHWTPLNFSPIYMPTDILCR